MQYQPLQQPPLLPLTSLGCPIFQSPILNKGFITIVVKKSLCRPLTVELECLET